MSEQLPVNYFMFLRECAFGETYEQFVLRKLRELAKLPAGIEALEANGMQVVQVERDHPDLVSLKIAEDANEASS